MKKFLERYLAFCARRAIRREQPRIIVVAGSVGKSSTKEAIGTALGAYERIHDEDPEIRVSPKNYNNELGVPLTIFNRPAPGQSLVLWIGLLWRATVVGLGLGGSIEADTLVLEFGTDRPGDLEYLAAIASPDVVVLTAIGAEHTEFFGSVAGVAQEELSLVRFLKKDGVIILNADDAEVMKAAELRQAPIVTFGESVDATVRLISSQIVIDKQDIESSGLDIHIVALGSGTQFRIPGVFGKPQALAATAALAVVHALDVDFSQAVERLRRFSGMPGRTRLIEGIKRTMLLDDTYNSSPLAALSALRDLAAYPIQDEGRKWAALGDMLELGNLAEEAHRQVGEAAAKAGIDWLVVCGTLAHVVAEAAKQAGMSEGRIFTFAKSSEAGLFIQERLKQGDVVLIKGSQGARMEKITKELMAHPERAEELLVRQTREWD